MSTKTTNFGLTKLELTDAADITQLNGNWDIIDENLDQLLDTASDLAEDITNAHKGLNQVTNGDLPALREHIEDVDDTVSSLNTTVSSLNTTVNNINNTTIPKLNQDINDINKSLITKAPGYVYGTADMTPGVTKLTTGTLYIVYE